MFDRSALWAASRDLTTRFSLNPSGVAWTTRSVPGMTFAYVAVAPERVGAGNVHGELTLYVFPSCLMLASGARVPPPEKVMSAAAAFGSSSPEDVVSKVVSTGPQPDARFARTGSGSNSAVNVPSGWAVTNCVGVVSSLTSTDEPDAAAFCDAAASGDRSLPSDVADEPPCGTAAIACVPAAPSICTTSTDAASQT